MQLACHFAHPSYRSYDSYHTHVFKQKCSTRKWQYNLHNIPKLNVQRMPTTYPRDGEAKHLRRRNKCPQSVYKHCPSDSKAPSKHQLLNVPAENVSKHQVHILSATKRRESVQVIRDVSEHCQAVI